MRSWDLGRMSLSWESLFIFSRTFIWNKMKIWQKIKWKFMWFLKYIFPFCLKGPRYLFCINSLIYHIFFFFLNVNCLFDLYCYTALMLQDISRALWFILETTGIIISLLWRAYKSQQLVLLEDICFVLDLTRLAWAFLLFNCYVTCGKNQKLFC